MYGNEFVSDALQDLKESVSSDLRDSWRDEYNNEIGDQIANYVKENFLKSEWQQEFENHLLDAVKRGDLIPQNNDSRIPPDNNGDGIPDGDPIPNWSGSSGNVSSAEPAPISEFGGMISSV
jgi:hypothetical protein